MNHQNSCAFAVSVVLAALAAGADDADDAVARLRADEPNAYEAVVAQGEAAAPGLIGVLGDRAADVRVRMVAANALGDIGSKKAVTPLIEALKDPDFNVRRCAALALAKIGDPEAEGPLKRLAAQDPFAWPDPDAGKTRYLLREDARTALETLMGRTPAAEGAGARQKEVILADASKPPPSPVKVMPKQLPWPFPGDSRAQNIWNNYQQPTDAYVHAGIDLIHPAGTEVRAVDDGFVAVVATNYPDWSTHHFFIVTPQRNGREGWCYTHLDPATFTFKAGDAVKRGQVLGKLVDFHVGDNKGADHLHLHYVRFTTGGRGKGRSAADGAAGGVEVQSLVDPLLFFDWEDTVAPTIEQDLHFVREGTLKEFAGDADGVPTVRGPVDVIAGISDRAYDGHGGTWMAPVVTVEITGEGTKPWRKLVLDQRGAVENPRAAGALYLSSAEKRRWTDGRPPFPVIHFLRVTNTDGDGVIEDADRAQTWDTRTWRDGVYDVTVRAWDLKGNGASRTARVRVDNTAAE